MLALDRAEWNSPLLFTIGIKGDETERGEEDVHAIFISNRRGRRPMIQLVCSMFEAPADSGAPKPFPRPSLIRVREEIVVLRAGQIDVIPEDDRR